MYSLGSLHDQLASSARTFLTRPLPYSFTETEQLALRSFFTNLDGHVFFFHNVPSNVMAATIARYSRIKNKRGIRGIWVEEVLPYLLSSEVASVIEAYQQDSSSEPKDYEGIFLKENGIKVLDDFARLSDETANIFAEFINLSAADPEYIMRFVESKRARRMLKRNMDGYGHNSIARAAFVALCCENISILAAKTLEWTRPATGIIELSTRYVEMSGAQLYPIWDEFGHWGVNPEPVQQYFLSLFDEYRGLVGDEKKLDGPLPSFFRERYASLISDPKDLEKGVMGETFDLCGNLLPTAACTSVAIVTSGEAFPTILKHLILDGTAENLALCDIILAESSKVGGDQFVRHYQPTEVDRRGWDYLSTRYFVQHTRGANYAPWAETIDTFESAGNIIIRLFWMKNGFAEGDTMNKIAGKLFYQSENGQIASVRTAHDKLPSEFEAFTVSFEGVMSWRGWRDMHRMSFAAHNRTLVTPKLGFYKYDKPAPMELTASFSRAEVAGRKLYVEAQRCGVPEFMLQYLLPMGFNVGYSFSTNLREHEFCNWQRTKFDVNHEVRQSFLAHEKQLRQALPWWHLFSRANTTQAYVFARSEGPDKTGVPLSQETALA